MVKPMHRIPIYDVQIHQPRKFIKINCGKNFNLFWLFCVFFYRDPNHVRVYLEDGTEIEDDVIADVLQDSSFEKVFVLSESGWHFERRTYKAVRRSTNIRSFQSLNKYHYISKDNIVKTLKERQEHSTQAKHRPHSITAKLHITQSIHIITLAVPVAAVPSSKLLNIATFYHIL